MATHKTDDITCSHSVLYNSASHMQICRNQGCAARPSLSVLGVQNKVVDFLQIVTRKLHLPWYIGNSNKIYQRIIN